MTSEAPRAVQHRTAEDTARGRHGSKPLDCKPSHRLFQLDHARLEFPASICDGRQDAPGEISAIVPGDTETVVQPGELGHTAVSERQGKLVHRVLHGQRTRQDTDRAIR